MPKIIKIKRGLDIPLSGAPTADIENDSITERFGIVPDDFPGYKWKAAVEPGQTVKAGEKLLYAKEDDSICLVSPANGTVEEVHRGERRKIEYVSVKGKADLGKAVTPAAGDRESILETLKKSGLFAMLRQRPFDMVPFMPDVPRDIFVTAFDTAPLAARMLDFTDSKMLEKGLEILAKLTDGKVYLSVPTNSGITSRIAEVVEFEGPHPAGNVGTQIAVINPINKGEVVWTLDAITAARIGRLFNDGTLDFTAYVALSGPDVRNPHIIKTTIGADIMPLLKGQITDGEEHKRVISGNVLTGKKVTADDSFLRFPYRQITVIDEGDDADEFMGWASLNPRKYSVSGTFPTFLKGLGKGFHFDARLRGGHRAMIMNNEYDKVFPMDIYPEYLIKAIMAKDIERMEKLGIYEVASEDFALPEFVDTSKIELQKIVRDGLDYLRQETI